MLEQYCQVGGQAVLGRQLQTATPWLTERHGYDPTSKIRTASEKVKRNFEEVTSVAFVTT